MFLCLPSYWNYEDEQVEIVKSIPEVECTSDLLNAEILHYLAQQDKSNNLCYWNMILQIDKYGRSVVHTCTLLRLPDFVPNEGTAFLQYGNDVFVIQGKYDKSLFRKRKGYRRDIRMMRQRRWILDKNLSPKKKYIQPREHVSFFMIKFSDDKVFKMQSEYDPCR